MGSLFVKPVTNAPLNNQLSFQSTINYGKAEGIKRSDE